ncbi:hypothetical protein SKAU_G00352090 [Synaphobranchus kaupii]|uniref:Uncharacterized protein n=1 Tax=Synaphobranchus kaupii TaxID=118154 RepID=A0A9Q1II98_SYNKA|nr:hypothetical protein SKAU_G00352090 [Synaphobranchus kaupii]
MSFCSSAARPRLSRGHGLEQVADGPCMPRPCRATLRPDYRFTAGMDSERRRCGVGLWEIWQDMEEAKMGFWDFGYQRKRPVLRLVKTAHIHQKTCSSGDHNNK